MDRATQQVGIASALISLSAACMPSWAQSVNKPEQKPQLGLRRSPKEGRT